VVLEKPQSRVENFNRLKKLSDNKHYFYTEVCIISPNSEENILEVIETIVQFRRLSKAKINKYLDQDLNFKIYAIGYDSLEHFSASFVKEIKGIYNSFLRGILWELLAEKSKELNEKNSI